MSVSGLITKIKKGGIYKKVLIVISIIFIFTVSAAASYFYLNFKKVFVNGINNGKVAPSPLIADPDAPYNVLLLGYGGGGHDGGALSDTLIVAHIQPNEKKITLISVPRDTWVELPVRSDLSEYHKINAAYAIGLDDNNFPLKEPKYRGEAGAGELAKHAIEQVVGMPMAYFVSVSFDGFKDSIDILGGVDVNVPVTFDDFFYPIKGRENDICNKSSAEIFLLHEKYSDTELHHQFECRYENIHFDKGIQLMDGETALKFVRSRASAQHGGDFARSQRQQAVLFSIKNKILSTSALDDLVPFINKFTDTVRTDLDIAAITQLAEILGDPSEITISTVNLSEENVFVSTTSPDGQFILIPKEGEGIFSGVHTFVAEQIEK
ncbi:LCP family protein [Patescibacteria group bacterium]|nr:LCP family protein [Patescibacteria group bacterium]